MPILITVLIILLGVAIYGIYSSTQANKLNRFTKELYEENRERRRQFVKSVGPNAQVIVNNGYHFFFIDKEQRIFGYDETGKYYSFDGLLGIQKYNNGISFMHKDNLSIWLGKDPTHDASTVAMDLMSITAIYATMMPVVKENLRKELDKYGVNPTHEYEHEGSIFGCDLNSKKWYVVYGCPQVFEFAELKKVTIDDVSNNSMCDANYIIHIYIKHEDSTMDQYPEFDEYFDCKDATFNSILAMFKGIRNRQ